jgi:hypothetical protein
VLEKALDRGLSDSLSNLSLKLFPPSTFQLSDRPSVSGGHFETPCIISWDKRDLRKDQPKAVKAFCH